MPAYDHQHVLLRRDSNNSLDEILRKQKEYFYERYIIPEKGNDNKRYINDNQQQQRQESLVDTRNVSESVSPEKQMVSLIDNGNKNDNTATTNDNDFYCTDLLLLLPSMSSSSSRKTASSSTLKFFGIFVFYLLGLILYFANNSSFTSTLTTPTTIPTSSHNHNSNKKQNNSNRQTKKVLNKKQSNSLKNNNNIRLNNMKPSDNNGLLVNRRNKMINKVVDDVDVDDNNVMIPIPNHFHLFSKKSSKNTSKNFIRDSLSSSAGDKLVILDLSGLSKCYKWNTFFSSEVVGATTFTTTKSSSIGNNSNKNKKNNFKKDNDDNDMKVIIVNSLCNIENQLHTNTTPYNNDANKKSRLLIIVDNPIDRSISKQDIKQRQLLIHSRLFRLSQQRASNKKIMGSSKYFKTYVNNNNNALTRSILCKNNNKDYDTLTDIDYKTVQKILNDYAYTISSNSLIKKIQEQQQQTQKQQFSQSHKHENMFFDGTKNDKIMPQQQQQQKKKQIYRRNYAKDIKECSFHRHYNQEYNNNNVINTYEEYKISSNEKRKIHSSSMDGNDDDKNNDIIIDIIKKNYFDYKLYSHVKLNPKDRTTTT